MSKWIEYAKLIPAGIKNFDAWVEGFSNDIRLNNSTLSDDKVEEITRRRVICEGCPFMSENAKTSTEYHDLIKEHYSTDRNDKHCTFCGCPLDTRTASLSKGCGISSWNKNHKERQLELKWDVYASKSE